VIVVVFISPGVVPAGTVTVIVIFHDSPAANVAGEVGQALVSSVVVQPFDDDLVIVSTPAALPVLVTV
jgi:hypothetical protein